MNIVIYETQICQISKIINGKMSNKITNEDFLVYNLNPDHIFIHTGTNMNVV